jgi:hypothetical protein
LGLSSSEIDDTTPIELHELIEEYYKAQDQENHRFGMVCSVLANLKRDPDKRPEPFTPASFFGSLSEPAPTEVEPTEEQSSLVLEDWIVHTKTRIKMKRTTRARKEWQTTE